MRHCLSIYVVFTRQRGQNPLRGNRTQRFLQGEGKLGTPAIIRLLPPARILAASMARTVQCPAQWAFAAVRLIRPLLPPLLSWLFGRGVLLAAIMEDLPYRDNRLVPGAELGIGHRTRQDLKTFRQQIARALKPYRFLCLRQAPKNSMLAHVCRAPAVSAPTRRPACSTRTIAHTGWTTYVIEQLPFFPSSGGTNPALTIAANALRVADHLLADSAGGRDGVARGSRHPAGAT